MCCGKRSDTSGVSEREDGETGKEAKTLRHIDRMAERRGGGREGDKSNGRGCGGGEREGRV